MEPVPAIYWFGPFRLDASRRMLELSGTPVPLSSRGFDILQTLIEARDRVVGREELMARVWPGVTVEASNLTVQMSALRRALGDTGDEPALITTVSGRGYRFIGRLETFDPPAPTALQAATIETAPAEIEMAAKAPSFRDRHLRAVMLGGAAVLAISAWLLHTRIDRTELPPRLSIVVMPFRNLGGDPGRAYLADAVSDDLTTDLSHIPGSLVIARESADSYKGRAVPADQIGRALNVRYLLEGSLHSEGDTLRINAQLIDTVNGAHIWAERFDTGTTHMLDALNDIVRRIASALDVALVEAEAARGLRERPSDPDALDLFFRARSVMDRGATLPDINQAQALLERAIKLEPDFVDALAALGWLLVLKEQGFEYPGQAQDDAEAQQVISHALVLAPRNPAALAARGRFLASGGKCAEARAAFDAALAIDAGNVSALWGQALCAWRMGDPEQVRPALEATLRIDPQGPSVTPRTRLLGLALLFGGHPNQALPYLLQSETREGAPPPDTDSPTQDEMTRVYLIAATALNGDVAEARRRYQDYKAIWHRRSVWRLAALFTPAQTAVPYYVHIADALVQAGMPRYAACEVIAASANASPLDGGEFTATPMRVPGAETIDTIKLRALLAAGPAPLLLDAGKGMALIPHSILLSDTGAADAASALQATAVAARLTAAAGGVVVMDTGCSGIDGYNATLALAGKTIGKLYWYRGGEEAWAAAGLAAEDRRAR